MEQGKVVTPVIEINEKVKAVVPTKQKQSKKSELPETGGEESTNKGMLFGGLFSILGLTLLRRNKKNNKSIINLKLTGLFHKLYEVSLFLD